MKRTLAILLALLAAASITLTSCNLDDRQPVGGNDDDDIDYSEDDDDDETKDTDDKEDETNKKPTTQTLPSVVYAGVELNLRTSTNTSSSSNIYRKVPFGTKLNYISTSGAWAKVKLDNDDTECYVQTQWLAETNTDFKFTDCDDQDITVATTENKVVFYFSPFVCQNLETALQNALFGDGFIKDNFQSGYKLTRLEMNDNWVKVSFVGTIKTSETKSVTYTEQDPGIFYVQVKSFKDGRISDPTFPGNSGGSGGGLG